MRVFFYATTPKSPCTVARVRRLVQHHLFFTIIEERPLQKLSWFIIYASVEDDNSTCKICIEDNGVGASDKQIDRLNHTPHYMLCDTNTTEQRHGLGLLIVKQIIKGHNGKIIIDHSQYGGFKVTLILPK